MNVATVLEGKIVLFIGSAKIPEREGGAYPHPTISHTILALSTQWVSSPLREQKRGVSPKFNLIVLCLV